MIKKIALIILSIIPLITQANTSDIPQHKENIKNILKKQDEYNFKIGEPKKFGNTGLYYFQNEDKTIFTDKDFSFFIYGEAAINYNGVLIRNSLDPKINEKAFKLTKTLNKNDLIHYQAENEKGHIFAFMDYTCPYCKKFHTEEKDQLLKRNISVTYIPFLRQNIKHVLDYTVAMYCEKDMVKKKELIDRAFLNPHLFKHNNNDCNLFDLYLSFISLGGLIEIKGTPTFITDTGIVIYGLKSAEEIYKVMNIKQ